MSDAMEINNPLEISNAIGWVHYVIRGGWKWNLIFIPIGYAVVMGGLLILTLLQPNANAHEVYHAWSYIFAFLQLLILDVGGSLLIQMAIQRDYTLRMMESHRLMPQTSAQAIRGYFFGSSAPAVSLWVVNLLLGTIAWTAGGGRFMPWFSYALLVLVFTLMLWMSVILLSLSMRLPLIVIFIILAAGIFGWVAIVFLGHLLPGLLVLVTPVIGLIILTEPTGFVTNLPVIAGAMLMQIYFTVLFFEAARRRFRRHNFPAFTPLLGLFLLLGWICCMLLGIWQFRALIESLIFIPGGFLDDDLREIHPAAAQIVAAVCSAMLLAVLPISSSAWYRALWRAGAAHGGTDRQRKPASPFWITLLSSVMIMFLPLIAYDSAAPDASLQGFNLWTWPLTAVVVISTCIGLSCAHKILYRKSRLSLLLTILWVGVFWIFPMIIEGVTFIVRANYGPNPTGMTFVGSVSPIGALCELWVLKDENYWPGIAIQIAIALVALFLARDKRAKVTAPPVIVPGVGG